MRTLKELEESINKSYLVEKELEKEYAQRIAEVREAAGVSQADFASTVGASPETVQQIEEGSFTGSSLELHRIFNEAKEAYRLNS
jgi:DNA-binding XRE family transcriptional regulator